MPRSPSGWTGDLKIPAMAVTTFMHAVACVELRSIVPHIHVLAAVVSQLQVLIAASWVAMVVVISVRSSLIKVALLCVNLLCLLLIGAPMGTSIDIELVLLMNLVMVSGACLPTITGLCLSAVAAAVVVVAQQPLTAWGEYLAGATPSGRLTLGLAACILALAAAWLRQHQVRTQGQQRSIDQLSGAILKLTDSNVGFQQAAVIAEERARVAECNRITREIHDSIGHNLTTLMMLLENATQLARGGSPELTQLLRVAHAQAREGLTETRRSVRTLRTVGTQRTHGISAMQALVNRFELVTGTRVRVEYTNFVWPRDEDLGNDIYHIVQEGLTNSFRHGKATEIRLQFWRGPGELIVTIEDNGAGCKDVVEGIGITGMRERLEKTGGSLHLSTNKWGFGLTAHIPLSMMR